MIDGGRAGDEQGNPFKSTSFGSGNNWHAATWSIEEEVGCAGCATSQKAEPQGQSRRKAAAEDKDESPPVEEKDESPAGSSLTREMRVLYFFPERECVCALVVD